MIMIMIMITIMIIIIIINRAETLAWSPQVKNDTSTKLLCHGKDWSWVFLRANGFNLLVVFVECRQHDNLMVI